MILISESLLEFYKIDTEIVIFALDLLAIDFAAFQVIWSHQDVSKRKSIQVAKDLIPISKGKFR